MSSEMFGWELTFNNIENDVKKKQDVLIAFLHWNLIKRGFRCVGIGDEKTLSGDEQGREVLPAGWNDGEHYSLRYILMDKLYILHGLITDGNAIINLVRAEDLAVSNIALNIDNVVKELSGPIDNVIPIYKDLMHEIKRDLVDTICNKPAKTVQTQTQGTPRPSSAEDPRFTPLRIREDPIRMPSRNPPSAGMPDWDSRDPFSIGRSDLDPLGRGGGGMIFNPFGPRGPINPGQGIPGGLPRGALPPGARFDPFGPPVGPNPPRRPPPGADHFPPPGFDDMFM